MPRHFALFISLPMIFNTGAHAQTQAASPEPPLWDHNGSVMSLVAKGSSREFYYQKPRTGMLEAGAKPGSLLFRGEVSTPEQKCISWPEQKYISDAGNKAPRTGAFS